MPDTAMTTHSKLPTKLKVRDLNFYYGGFQALKDVEIDIPERQVTAFIGPAGSGKSTLLTVLNRTLELVPGARCSGLVQLDGVDRFLDVLAVEAA